MFHLHWATSLMKRSIIVCGSFVFSSLDFPCIFMCFTFVCSLFIVLCFFLHYCLFLRLSGYILAFASCLTWQGRELGKGQKWKDRENKLLKGPGNRRRERERMGLRVRLNDMKVWVFSEHWRSVYIVHCSKRPAARRLALVSGDSLNVYM